VTLWRKAKASPGWLGPAIWALAAIFVFLAYLGLLRQNILDTQRRETSVDAQLVSESAQMHLSTNRDYLLMLAGERARGFLDAASFQERGARFVADHPELVCLNWVDADFVITDVAPLEGNEQVVGLPLDLPESRRVSRLAMAERHPGYTRPFDIIQGARAFELWVPVFSGDVFVGLLGAVYSYERLLQVVVDPLVRGRNLVGVTDADGKVILELPSQGTADPKLARQVALTPAENGALLTLTPYGRGAANRTLRLLEIICLALVLGAGFAMWMLRREVEARRRSESALRTSEAKARGILDNVGVGVAVLSPELEILEVNPLMREWFPAIDPLKRPRCYQSFCEPPGDGVCDDCPAARSLQDGRIHESTKSVARDGALRSYHMLSSPVIDPDGTVTAAIQIVEDVTERLAVDAQSRQAQKMEAVGRLAGGVAHDFNNMLQVIIGHAELAMDDQDPAQPWASHMREIRSAADRSANLVSQLLAFARKQVTAPRVLDLNETVEGTISLLRRLIGENIALSWQPGEHVWPVRMDPTQVDQVLANLCVNARDAFADVGRIAIETGNGTFDDSWCEANPGFLPGNFTVLTVSDDGSGMDAATLTRLFEPFFTTKMLGQGTGLGLATVYGIVRQNGGFIKVDSEPGRGTRFRIHLPRHAEKTEVRAENEPSAPPARGDELLLLVEDEPMILDAARRRLEKLGYRVLVAASPDEALAAAAGFPGTIDLLITDVIMPGMNGHELSDRLQAGRPGLRTLFMSGYSGDVIARDGALADDIHFLQKPFSVHDLSAAIRRALGAAT
jgi:signal transduction histidine kinase/CheY-like chemotaxis protein